MIADKAIEILGYMGVEGNNPDEFDACNMGILAIQALDKTRVEIEKKKQKINFKGLDSYEKAQAEMRLSTLNEFLQIIDKYKAESEGEG